MVVDKLARRVCVCVCVLGGTSRTPFTKSPQIGTVNTYGCSPVDGGGGDDDDDDGSTDGDNDDGMM